MPFLDDLLDRFDFLKPSEVVSFLRSLDEERITFYPTYGHREGDLWRIPLRVWASEPRERTAETLAKTAGTVLEGLDELDGMEEVDERRKRHLLERLADWVADDEGDQKVVFHFDADPEERSWRLEDERGRPLETDDNGVVAGEISLPGEVAEELLERQGSKHGWLTFHAVSRGHGGQGRVRLIPPEGRSVISDIDDTIKVTEIPKGKPTVLCNTFVRDFEPAPGMADRYRALGADTAFHFVSGSPYQLFGPLSRFLHSGEVGFPRGSYHMQAVGKNLRVHDSWEQIAGLLLGGDQAGFDRKVSQISRILRDFAARTFRLFGDSGECDPEVYRRIQKDFGDQVEEIWIRDVTGEGPAGRLKGLRRIEAEDLGEGGCDAR